MKLLSKEYLRGLARNRRKRKRESRQEKNAVTCKFKAHVPLRASVFMCEPDLTLYSDIQCFYSKQKSMCVFFLCVCVQQLWIKLPFIIITAINE